ncbi:MAG: hypothetical protein HY364_02925 [Candidatus Aenigmarchaeota archaeon]|nr:hypothetical protein [Candidatus Aenigmarchaeota archaeon]
MAEKHVSAFIVPSRDAADGYYILEVDYADGQYDIIKRDARGRIRHRRSHKWSGNDYIHVEGSGVLYIPCMDMVLWANSPDAIHNAMASYDENGARRSTFDLGKALAVYEVIEACTLEILERKGIIPAGETDPVSYAGFKRAFE